MLEFDNFDSIKIRLASPEKIRIYEYDILSECSKELFILSNYLEDSYINNFVVDDGLVILSIRNEDSNYDIYQYESSTDDLEKIIESNKTVISLSVFDDRYIIYTEAVDDEPSAPYKNLLYNLCIYDKVVSEKKIVTSDVYLGYFGHIDSYIFYNTMDNAYVYDIKSGKVEKLNEK